MSFSNLIEFNYKGIFIFYIIIAAAFLPHILGCHIQKLFDSHMLVKHGIGILTLYFFIMLDSKINNELINKKDEYIFFKNILATILIYIIFLMSTRNKGIYFNIFFLSLAIIFLLNSYKESLDDNKFKERIENIVHITVWIGRISVLSVCVGFYFYYQSKRKEYKNNFDFYTFVIGNIKCKSLQH